LHLLCEPATAQTLHPRWQKQWPSTEQNMHARWLAAAQTRRLTLPSRGRAPASRVTPLMSNVRRRESRMPASAIKVLNPNRRSPRFAFGTSSRLVWAVRPLAASAPLADLQANEIQGRARSGTGASFKAQRLNGLNSRSLVFAGSLPRDSVQGHFSKAGSHAQRSLPFGRKKRLATGLVERIRIQAQAVHRAPPNPSIELTCPGKPGHAAHVKR
jgi:hypothetical protein